MGRSNESFRAYAPLLGLGLLLEAALVALVAIVWRIPDTFYNLYGYSAATLPFFLQGWGWTRPPALPAQTFQWAFIVLWLGLHGVWLLALRQVGKVTGRTALAIVLGLALLFNLTLALAMPPAFSTDSLNYLAYGRMVAFHGLNPYTTLPSALAGDPVLALPFWDIVCPYGPLWVGLCTGMAWLAGSTGILGGLLLLKGLAGLAQLALAGLLYTIAAREAGGQPAGALPPIAVALGVAWSPLFLLEGAGNGHNDLVMLALAAAGLLLLRRNRPWTAYLLLLLSALVKYVSLLLLAYLFLAWLRQQVGRRERAILAGKALLLGLAVVALAILPFWAGPQSILNALLGETTRIRVSPVVFLLRGLEALWAAWPATVAQAPSLAFLTTQVLLKGTLVVIVLIQGRALWRRHRGQFGPLLGAWEATALLYVCFLHGATFPWYFTWPAGTTLLESQRQKQRRLAGLSFGLAALGGLFYGIAL
jgi:hypothetical protein